MTQSTKPLTPKLFRRQVLDAARNGEPATPRCRHAPPLDFCGGCTFQDRSYAAQVAAKQAALRALWQNDLPAEMLAQLVMVGSPEPFAYRTRMDYVASKGRFGLRRGGKFNYIVDLQECHLIPSAAFATARGVFEHAVALGLPDKAEAVELKRFYVGGDLLTRVNELYDAAADWRAAWENLKPGAVEGNGGAEPDAAADKEREAEEANLAAAGL